MLGTRSALYDKHTQLQRIPLYSNQEAKLAFGIIRAPAGISPTIRSGLVRMLFAGRALILREVGALSDLDDISVRIADVAANLAVLIVSAL
jgi:hypothetical protein